MSCDEEMRWNWWWGESSLCTIYTRVWKVLMFIEVHYAPYMRWEVSGYLGFLANKVSYYSYFSCSYGVSNEIQMSSSMTNAV